MIFRTRWISTALLACGLALQPVRAVGQSASEAQETSAPAASQSASSSSSNSTGQPTAVEATPNAPANPAQPQDPQQHPVPTVTRSTGEEDRETEQIIQQELQTSGEPEAGPPRPGTNVALGHDEVLIRGDEQEKNQDIYKARGHVEIRFRTYILHADEATYDSTTGQVTAVGHVVFDGGPHNEHLVGTHATYDVSRDTGVFYDVVGSTGVKVKNQMMFLTSSTPFFFTGKVVDKLGPDRYRVNHGYVTSCQLPKPKWEFNSTTAIIEVGDEAKMHNATLRIHGIPLFYFPYMEHPVDNLGRKSGFLIPEIGQSNVRGFIFGDGFYWAINRNSDATIGASLYSKIGWAQYANYRVVGYKYRFQAQYFGVIDDKGPPVDGQNPGGHELKADGFWDLPDGFRGVVSVDNLSSYLFRLRFALELHRGHLVRGALQRVPGQELGRLRLWVPGLPLPELRKPGSGRLHRHCAHSDFRVFFRRASVQSLTVRLRLRRSRGGRHSPRNRIRNRSGRGTARRQALRFHADFSPRLDVPAGSQRARDLLHSAAGAQPRGHHRHGG